MSDIENRVKKIIAEQMGIGQAYVLNEQYLDDDLGADSLDEVEILLAIENEFEIEISDAEASDDRTVGEIIEALKLRLKQ